MPDDAGMVALQLFILAPPLFRLHGERFAGRKRDTVNIWTILFFFPVVIFISFFECSIYVRASLIMACIMPVKPIVLFVVFAVMSPVACWNPPIGYVPGSPKLNAKPPWPSAKRCSFGYGGWPVQGQCVQSALLEQLERFERENEQLHKKNSELSTELYAKDVEIELLYGTQMYTDDRKNETKLRKEVQNARWLGEDTFIVLYKLVQD